MKKDIIILGGSKLQLDLIFESKKMYFTVHLIDGDKNCVGQKYSDEFYAIDFSKKELVLDIALKINPCAILTIATEAGNVTSCYVSEKMGLNSNSYETSLITTNKIKMKNHIKNKKGIFCEYEVLTETENSNWKDFPCIIKPIDSSAGRGVSFVKSKKELSKAIVNARKFSSTHEVIVEKYIKGRQYSIESISSKGLHQVVSIVEEFITEPPIIIETQQLLPARISKEKEKRIELFALNILELFNINYGASHVEIREDSLGNFYLIEIASRMGGWRSELIRLATGINFCELLINSVLNKNVTFIKSYDKIAIVKMILNKKHLEEYLYLKENYDENIFSELELLEITDANNLADSNGFYFVCVDNKSDIDNFYNRTLKGKKMKDKIVITGGGISGLLSAYLLSEVPKYEIHLIEKSNSFGGLLKCFDYGKFGKFDYGAHNIIETGIKELDSILFNLLPEKEWHISSAINGQRRALTGINFNNNIQKNSPFLDLRFHKEIDEFRIDFLENFEKNKEIKKTDAYSYSKSLFGKLITEKAIVPVFESLYRVHPSNMDYMAMFLTPLVRVGLFDKTISTELLKTPRMSSLLAFPEQRELSPEFIGSKKVFYPKKYGMYRVVDVLVKRLKERGVYLHLNDEITNIDILNNKIVNIKTKNITFENIYKVIWTAGLYPLSNLLKIKSSSLPFEVAPKTVITNILLDKLTKLNDLSYMYNYDKENYIFRIDNYINYCSGAKRKGLYPISVEMLLGSEMCKDKEKINKLVLKELKKLNILKKNTKIHFIETEVLENGFPLLSKINVKTMDILRNKIRNKKIINLDIIGVLAEKDLFFEADIQKDLFKKIKG